MAPIASPPKLAALRLGARAARGAAAASAAKTPDHDDSARHSSLESLTAPAALQRVRGRGERERESGTRCAPAPPGD